MAAPDAIRRAPHQVAIRIGLVGLGKMGTNHLRVLAMLKDAELVFVHDANADTAARISAAHGLATCARVEDGLKNADAIVICTPTEQVRIAAAHVKNIFVEKRLANTLQEAGDNHDFAVHQGLRLQVGFIERFNPAVQQLKAVLDKLRQSHQRGFHAHQPAELADQGRRRRIRPDGARPGPRSVHKRPSPFSLGARRGP